MPPSRLFPCVRRRGAFTLIELMVSMTVMVLLVVLVTQLMNSATAVTTASTRRLDADAQARIVFNRMSYDFSNMILRKDVDCLFLKNSGTGNTSTPNDVMYFYSETPGYFSNATYFKDQSPASLIGYRVSNRGASATAQFPDNILERVARGVHYDGGDPARQTREQLTFLSFPLPTLTDSNPLPAKESTMVFGTSVSKSYVIGMAPTWDNTTISNSSNFVYALSDSVFRMEFCFLMKDPLKGGASTTPKPFAVPDKTSNATPWTSKPFMIDDYTGTTVSMRAVTTDVAAVVVTIATLDSNSRVLISNNQLALARDALPDSDAADVVGKWSDLINNTDRSGSFRTKTQLPQSVIAQMHVYQRFFYLNSK